MQAAGGRSPWGADTRDAALSGQRAQVLFAIIAIGVVVVAAAVALAVVLM